MTSHYAALEVSETASAEEIRQAHRRLVRANNPTRLTGRARSEAEDRLRAINTAFNVLKDQEKRREYDAALPRTEKPHASRSVKTSSKGPKPKKPKPPKSPKSAGSTSGVGAMLLSLCGRLASWCFYLLKSLWYLLVSFLKWLGPLLLIFLKWLAPLLLVLLKWLWPKFVYLLYLPFKMLWWLLRLPIRFIRWMWNPRK